MKYVEHLHLSNYSVYARVQLFIHQMSFAVFEVKLECVHTLFKHDILFRNRLDAYNKYMLLVSMCCLQLRIY